jgi:hypothetical protein
MVLGVLGSKFRVSIFESAVQIETLDVGVGHDARNLFVVIQDGKAR